MKISKINLLLFFIFIVIIIAVLIRAMFPPPVAAFIAMPHNGNAPLTVQFSDLSTNTPTSWMWEYRTLSGGSWIEFGEGNKNPSFTFPVGTFDIRLTVNNPGGSNTKIEPGFIKVKKIDPLSQVTHIIVIMTPCMGYHPDYGNIIYPDLRDASNISVQWSGVELPVDIEIKTDRNMGEKTVFKGTGTISGWMDRGIEVNIPWHSAVVPYDTVPFSKMYIPSEIPLRQAVGFTYITVHTPDGKTYSAISSQPDPLTRETCLQYGYSYPRTYPN